MEFSISWDELKQLISDKNLPIQFVDKGNLYTIFTQEGSAFYTTRIRKETPKSVDQQDFEDNHQSSANERILIDRSKILRQTTSQDLSIGPLNFTTSFIENVKINSVLMHFSADPKNNDVEVSFGSKDGSNFDTLLRFVNVNGKSDVFLDFFGNFLLEEGDEIIVTCSNTTLPSSTVFVTVIGEKG